MSIICLKFTRKMKRKWEIMLKYRIELISIATLIVTIISLIILIPKADLNIFFDPYYNNSTFAITNLGNKLLTDVKVSYKMDCQGIEHPPEYINLPVPTLTQSNGVNPTYIHEFDEHTKEIISNYLSNYRQCKDLKDAYYFLSFDSIKEKMKMDKFQDSFNSWMCDPCELIITVNSKQKSINKKFKLYNPMKLNLTINCVPDKINEVMCEVIMYNSNNMVFHPDNQKVFYMKYLEDGIEYRFKKKGLTFYWN